MNITPPKSARDSHVIARKMADCKRPPPAMTSFLMALLLPLICAAQQNAPKPLTEDDLVTLVRSGISDWEIKEAIEVRGYDGPKDVDSLLRLKGKGINDEMLKFINQSQAERYIAKFGQPGIPPLNSLFEAAGLIEASNRGMSGVAAEKWAWEYLCIATLFDNGIGDYVADRASFKSNTHTWKWSSPETNPRKVNGSWILTDGPPVKQGQAAYRIRALYFPSWGYEAPIKIHKDTGLREIDKRSLKAKPFSFKRFFGNGGHADDAAYAYLFAKDNLDPGGLQHIVAVHYKMLETALGKNLPSNYFVIFAEERQGKLPPKIIIVDVTGFQKQHSQIDIKRLAALFETRVNYSSLK